MAVFSYPIISSMFLEASYSALLSKPYSLLRVVTYLCLRRAGRDPVLSGVLSFFTSVALLTVVDAGAVSQIIWPTLIVSSIFLVKFWWSLFHHYAMGMGWTPVVLITGLVLDAMIVHHVRGSEHHDQGLFSQLLLICMALSLAACSAIAWFLKGITFHGPSNHVTRA